MLYNLLSFYTMQSHFIKWNTWLNNVIYLHQKMSSQHPYKTKQAADGGLRFRDNFAGKKGGET